MSKTITFQINAQGKVIAEAKGFQGTACEEALKQFQILNDPKALVEDTPELFASPDSSSLYDHTKERQ